MTRGEDEGSSDEEDEDQAWEGWDIESASSDDSSDSGRWIDIESDGENHVNFSDSDGEDGKNGDNIRKDNEPASDANRTSTLATTKVWYAYPQRKIDLMHPLVHRFSHPLTSHSSMICEYKQPAKPLKTGAVPLQSASSPPSKPTKRLPHPAAQTTRRLSSRRATFSARARRQRRTTRSAWHR